jgi:hypothetical protein
MRNLTKARRRRVASRGSASASNPRKKRLCLNHACQREPVPLDQILNQIFVFKEQIPPNLRERASIKPDLPVFRCDICGNLSQGRFSAEGDPVPTIASWLFCDSTTGVVEYHLPTVEMGPVGRRFR